MASKYDPIREGKKLAEAFYSSSKNIILYGLGLGYHIISLIELLRPNQMLYVIECNMCLTKLAFENTDIKRYLHNSQVVFISTEHLDNISNYFEEASENINRDVSLVIHDSSIATLPDSLTQIKDMLVNICTMLKNQPVRKKIK